MIDMMPAKIAAPQPPTGCLRFFFRLPIWLYHLRLGWLLGDRFLLLNHVGRKSGKSRHAVVEVARHDKEKEIYVVAAAYGEKAEWYRNLITTPEATIQISRKRMAVVAELLSPEASMEEMADYARRNPPAARALMRFLGYQVSGSEEEYRAIGRDAIRFVAFRPRMADDSPRR